MGFLNDLGRLIGAPVGNYAENKEEDVRRVRDSFEEIGFVDEQNTEKDFEDKPLGIITRGLDTTIKGFQKENDLKVDGLINPGGETENALMAKKKEKESTRSNGLFSEPILSEKNEKDQGVRVNKDKVAQRMGEYLLAQSLPPNPERKPILSTQERKEAILNNEVKNFKIVSNKNTRSLAPLHRIPFLNGIKKHEKMIEATAKKEGVDPDLVKAIMYVENSQGWYDGLIGNLNKTIRPMNVHVEYWKKLGYSRNDLKDPKKNVEAGIILLKRISKNVPDGDISKIATLYNGLGLRKVTNYGRQVERVYKKKPWKEK